MGRQGAYLQSQRTFQSQPLLCLAGTAGRYHHHRLCCAAFWKGNVARTGSEIAVAATDTASAPLRLLTRLLADREVDPANAVTLTNEVLIIPMGELRSLLYSGLARLAGRTSPTVAARVGLGASRPTFVLILADWRWTRASALSCTPNAS